MLNNQFQFPYNIQQNTLLQNPFLSSQQIPQTLNLTQIDNFEPVKSFKDAANVEWSLVKRSTDSTVDIPDPKSIKILDYWNHVFPGVKDKIYIYVVEGLRPPRVETEKPTYILYQWFSASFVPTFTYEMITPNEWLKANVYAASVLDARVSKLNALCKVKSEFVSQDKSSDQLLHVDEFDNGQAAE